MINPELSHDSVHVWRATLNLPSEQLANAANILSSREKKRSERFYSEGDRMRFIAAHVFLRQILARYLDLPPSKLEFECNAWGKPYLSGSGNHLQSLQFNLSHSNDMVIAAVSWNNSLGIDVEALRAVPDLMQIARCYFTRSEIDTLSTLSPAYRQKSFIQLWTRKEAVIKALGRGLSIALDHFEVGLSPAAPLIIMMPEPDGSIAGTWQLWDLVNIPGYWAALVTAGKTAAPLEFEYRFFDSE